ncbi:MAG: peptidyl-tRNA hydrolase [Candidatus Aenigmarchaeota archaeon]|nr:peptidyl-tRNA hydrolase [Candidatus Aenigmarchaeota archaeon]
MWKQVIVVRKDLRMSSGKIAAQAAHASLEAYKATPFEGQLEWEAWGSKKVILKVKSLRGLIEIQKRAKKAGLPFALIKDAGRTEVKPGTVTAIGIGPWNEDEIDKVTGDLKML